MSSNLIQEEHTEKRLTQLRLIKRSNINVVEFVQTQASLLFEKAVQETESRNSEARHSFHIFDDEVELDKPTARRIGRKIKEDFFGDDEDAVDTRHDHLIRSLEWLLIVDETWANVFSAGTRAYKFFLGKD